MHYNAVLEDKGVTLNRRLCDRGQSEVKWSRPNFEAGQTIKQTVEASLEMVKASPGRSMGVVNAE